MKRITFRAEKMMIERAHLRARTENSTLSIEFQRWLQQYVEAPHSTEDFLGLMRQLDYVVSGMVLSREKMNER